MTIRMIIHKLRTHRFLKPVWYAGLIILILKLCLILSTIIYPLPRDKIEQGYSTGVVFENGAVNYIALSPYNTFRIYTSFEDTPSLIKKSFINYEDKYFYFHPGFNPVSIIRALYLNIKYKKIVSGASTITMQIARMVEPKERIFASKLLEVIRALQLESTYTKKELLEIYLNLIPMGGNLEGIGSASFFYFNKQPKALSAGEIATLIGIPQSPNYSRPDLHPENALKVKNKVLNRLYSNRIISQKEYKSAVKTKIYPFKYRLPFIAPHLTMNVLNKYRHKKIITLTIDTTLQTICRTIAQKHKNRLRRDGIKNIGIIVVDNATGKVLSWIGGYAYENSHEGMIDTVSIKRSPGSTLKPFIYGKAIDAGIITPRYIIWDIKRYYAGYKVENYDKVYYGPITAQEALTKSLNSSAVYLLEKLHKGSLFPIVDALGLKMKAGEDIGLSIALGAKEITLLDLVTNYTAFSNEGRTKDVYYVDKKIKLKGTQILSKEAAFLISEMLASGTRLNMARSWEYTVRAKKIAWKTGTSFGNYDALCVGYDRNYTIGVWTGNADRTPSNSLIGVKAAAPLVFDIFNAITDDSGAWFERPPGVKTRQVSADTGKLPSPYSKNIITDYYIPGISPMEYCDRYKVFHLDPDTGYALINPDDHTNIEKKVLKVYPPQAIPWVTENLLNYEAPPPYDPAQLQYLKGNENIRILSPLKNKVYYLNKYKSSEDQKIELLCEPHFDTTNVYWILNDEIIASGPPETKRYFIPKPGNHRLICVDDKGRSGKLDFTIEVID